ncbi:hypothetical protein ABG067_007831, partial [Albugo candida]
MANLKSQRNKKTAKTLSEEEEKIRDDKEKTRISKAQTTYYVNHKRFILGSTKMERFKYAVVDAIRLANKDQYSLLLQFEVELMKWKGIVLEEGGGFSLLQSIIICYTYATTVIISDRFLENEISPRIIPLCSFSGAKLFFEENRILFWRIEAAPAQSLINKFCKLSVGHARVVRPALVLFTALLVTFSPKFPFEEKFEQTFDLRHFVCGTGFAAGDEDDLGEEVNQATFRNVAPTNPAEDDEAMEDEVDVGDLFCSDDENTVDEEEDGDDD